MSTSESIERFHKITIESPYNLITSLGLLSVAPVELLYFVSVYFCSFHTAVFTYGNSGDYTYDTLNGHNPNAQQVLLPVAPYNARNIDDPKESDPLAL